MSGVRVHDLGGRLWSDERGWGARPLEAAGLAGCPPGELHVVSLRPGAVRGNHYHDATEWLLVSEGTVEIRSRAGDSGAVESRVLAHGDMITVGRHRILYLDAASRQKVLADGKARGGLKIARPN